MLMSRSLKCLSLLAGVSALIPRVPSQSLELTAVFWEKDLFIWLAPLSDTFFPPAGPQSARSACFPHRPHRVENALGKVVTPIISFLQMGK